MRPQLAFNPPIHLTHERERGLMTPLIKCEMRWKRKKMMMMKVMEGGREGDVDEGRNERKSRESPPR